MKRDRPVEKNRPWFQWKKPWFGNRGSFTPDCSVEEISPLFGCILVSCHYFYADTAVSRRGLLASPKPVPTLSCGKNFETIAFFYLICFMLAHAREVWLVVKRSQPLTLILGFRL